MSEPAPQGLFNDLIKMAYHEFYGTGPTNDASFDGNIGHTAQYLTPREIALIKGEGSTSAFDGSVIRLLQDICEHPQVKIAYAVKIESDLEEPHSYGREIVTLSVDVKEAGVDRLRKAGAVLAGLAGAKAIRKHLGDIANREEAMLAMQVARESLGIATATERVVEKRKLDGGSRSLKG